MLVLVSGGIDVSFTAVAVSAMYMTTTFTLAYWPEMPWPLIFLLSIFIGGLLGAVNGVFIAFKLPTLIVTLGTLSVFRGFLLTFVGSQRISALPPDMRGFSRLMVARGTTEGGSFYALPLAFVALVLVILLTWFLLNHTMLGRSIYALGGSVESARRIGINVLRIQFFVYVYVGMLAGLAGIIHGSMSRMADPFSLVGQGVVCYCCSSAGRGATNWWIWNIDRYSLRGSTDCIGSEQPNRRRHPPPGSPWRLVS